MDRILLAISQPETWYAIAAGAGVFGVPVGWLVARISDRWAGLGRADAANRGDNPS